MPTQSILKLSRGRPSPAHIVCRVTEQLERLAKCQHRVQNAHIKPFPQRARFPSSGHDSSVASATLHQFKLEPRSGGARPGVISGGNHLFFFPGQQTISSDLWAAVTALALSKQLGLGTRARPAGTACRMIFILGEAWGTRTWELPFPPRWVSAPSCYLHHGTLRQGSRWE